ncbi:DUF3309 domain-containing protein [Methylobacter tundripaludum]|uniref:DUF3309 domain-containing protein n=1 Tax=Methylobacter tundripaludum TaxID=173365 RepID=UPI003F5440AE
MLSLSKHDRLDAVGRNFPAHPSTSSGRTEKFHSIHIGKLLLTISLVQFIILMLVGVIPTWPHSRGWGYGPSGGLGLVLIILLDKI